MPERDGQPDLSDFSNQLADAVQRAARWTLHVQARRGHGASAIAIGADLAITADHAIESGWEGWSASACRTVARRPPAWWRDLPRNWRCCASRAPA